MLRKRVTLRGDLLPYKRRPLKEAYATVQMSRFTNPDAIGPVFDRDCEINEATADDFSEQDENKEANKMRLQEVKDVAGSAHPVRQYLKMKGLQQYLESKIGGQKGQKEVEKLSGQIALALNWTYCRHHNKQLSVYIHDIIPWYLQLIEKEYQILLSEYCTFMESFEEWKAGTILNCLSALQRGSTWVIFHLRHDEERPNPSILIGFVDAIKAIRSSYSGAKKAEAARCKTIREAVLELKQPEGGLRELQDIIKIKSVEFLSLHQRTSYIDVDEHTYVLNLKIFFSGIYCFAAQGRVSGIEDMRKKDLTKLMNLGHADSDRFKTSAVYGYQPVSNVEEVIEHLVKYWEWRQRAVINANGVDSDHLFLDFNGKPASQRISVWVTQFWRMSANLHLTTTQIRQLVSTEAYRLHQEGKMLVVKEFIHFQVFICWRCF